jgi:hypothetical protein
LRGRCGGRCVLGAHRHGAGHAKRRERRQKSRACGDSRLFHHPSVSNSACKLGGENGRRWAGIDANGTQGMWLSMEYPVKANVGPDGNSSEQIPGIREKAPAKGRGSPIFHKVAK